MSELGSATGALEGRGRPVAASGFRVRKRHLASSALECRHAGAAAQPGQQLKLQSPQMDIRVPAGHVHRQRAQGEGLSAMKGSRECPKGQSRGMAVSRWVPVAGLEFSWLRAAAARGFVFVHDGR